MKSGLTPSQKRFCKIYSRLGVRKEDRIAAYRLAFRCEKMDDKTALDRAKVLFQVPLIKIELRSMRLRA